MTEDERKDLKKLLSKFDKNKHKIKIISKKHFALDNLIIATINKFSEYCSPKEIVETLLDDEIKYIKEIMDFFKRNEDV